MKKYFIVLYVCLFSACVNNSNLSDRSIVLSPEQCDSILVKYLVVEDDLYNLSISTAEAVELGISIDAYEKFCKLICDVNGTLADAKKRGVPIYRMDARDSVLSRVPSQYPGYEMPLCQMQLPDGHSTTSAFRGSGSIVVVGGADSPVWSIGFKDLLNNNRQFILTGSYFGAVQEREVGYNTIDCNIKWEWEVTKLAGDNCNAFASFWGINCLGIEGVLPAGIILEAYKFDPTGYSIRLKNDSYYSTFRWEIYRGGAKVSGPGELTIGQELLMSNCSYKQRYTLRILNYVYIRILVLTFNEIIMSKIIAVCLLIGGILGGCSTVNRQQLSPKKLFVVHIGEQLTIEQQGERLRYGRLLKPEVKGDSLQVPIVLDVPKEYMDYVTGFVRLVNRYLQKLEENEKMIVLNELRARTVDNAVLGSWIDKKNGRYVLKMNRENALKIGITGEKYDQVADKVKQVNNLIGEEKRIGIVANEVLYPSVSVFFNHGIFVMMKKSNLDKTFMEDLESLNF